MLRPSACTVLSCRDREAKQQCPPQSDSRNQHEHETSAPQSSWGKRGKSYLLSRSNRSFVICVGRVTPQASHEHPWLSLVRCPPRECALLPRPPIADWSAV